MRFQHGVQRKAEHHHEAHIILLFIALPHQHCVQKHIKRAGDDSIPIEQAHIAHIEILDVFRPGEKAPVAQYSSSALQGIHACNTSGKKTVIWIKRPLIRLITGNPYGQSHTAKEKQNAGNIKPFTVPSLPAISKKQGKGKCKNKN